MLETIEIYFTENNTILKLTATRLDEDMRVNIFKFTATPELNGIEEFVTISFMDAVNILVSRNKDIGQLSIEYDWNFHSPKEIRWLMGHEFEVAFIGPVTERNEALDRLYEMMS